MFELLEGAPVYREDDAEEYLRRRWWGGLTFGDLLDRAAEIHPNKEAFVDRQTRLTYAQARENAERLAIGLMDLGIKPLDRVMIQLPNWTEFVTVYFACQKIGAITVMLIDRYRQHEIQRLAEISEAVAWVLPPQYGKTDYLPVVDDVRAACPGIKYVITVRGEVDAPGFWSMERLIAENERTPENLARLAERAPDARQVAHMGPTGGTTGRAQDRAPHPQQSGLRRGVLLQGVGSALRRRQPYRRLYRPRPVLHQGLHWQRHDHGQAVHARLHRRTDGLRSHRARACHRGHLGTHPGPAAAAVRGPRHVRPRAASRRCTAPAAPPSPSWCGRCSSG